MSGFLQGGIQVRQAEGGNTGSGTGHRLALTKVIVNGRGAAGAGMGLAYQIPSADERAARQPRADQRFRCQIATICIS